MEKQKALNIILEEFNKIAQIPRPSHNEEKISEYLYQWALQHKLYVEKDCFGEIIIDKPAYAGFENVPRVILQAHMDMVCVAEEGVAYHALTDAIKVINDGEKLTAEGTSLGADDGIGVAICLYILQDTALQHGPLRVIFTTNEEDGMDAIHMDAKYLQGDYLINLDWEQIGSLCNSCAGGDFCNYSKKTDWQTPSKASKNISIKLNGLLGGHSGVNINLGHANTIVSVATLLCMLHQNGIDFYIADFSGGQAKNAIPSTASADIVISENDTEKALNIIEHFRSEFMTAFGDIEKAVVLSATISDTLPTKVLSAKTSSNLADLITVVPNNVHTMSPFVYGLVESSSNIGEISIDENSIQFTVFERSSVVYQATQIITICHALAEHFEFDFNCDSHIPGWAVNPNSKLTQIACEQYKKLTGKDMIVEPVHAGLECGAFAEKNSHLDMISIGPTLENVHTPNECCNIADIEIIAKLLINTLESIAKC